MALSCGIVGLPNVGKSTIFNALTRSAQALAANYPFATIEPNVGEVPVPDERLDVLAELEHSKRIVPATVRFVDIAGLVRGASSGQGLGNAFLSHIRETDAIAMVVRCFRDENVAHVEGSADPARDIEIVGIELALADLVTLQKRVDKLAREARANPKMRHKVAAAEHLIVALEAGRPARSFPASTPWPPAASTSISRALPSSALGKPVNPGMAEAVSHKIFLFGSAETASVGQCFASSERGSSCMVHSLLPALGSDSR